MNLTEKYISEYVKDLEFHFSERISRRIFDVEIEVDEFEYNRGNTYREKARVVFKKGAFEYECDFCDEHNYESGFHPVTINGRNFICFRKTLYGFTLMNADTLDTEYEYFPEAVFDGEESFIITDVKQINEFLIFEGCYWACPYECFAYDYKQKIFFDLSKACGIVSLNKTVLQNNQLIIYGTDANDTKKQITVSRQELILGIREHGKRDF